jgi:hypothetical protein
MVQERVSQGIDPIYAGELVREGVERDWPYIFTDLEFEPMIEARFAAIKQGFDHIRGRTRNVERAALRYIRNSGIDRMNRATRATRFLTLNLIRLSRGVEQQ